jgi:methyl acetate hydrolase
MSWDGMANSLWWADRESGVSGCFCTQLLPHNDGQVSAVFADFEKEVYRLLQEESAGRGSRSVL